MFLFHHDFLAVVDVNTFLGRLLLADFLAVHVVPVARIERLRLHGDERHPGRFLIIVIGEGYIFLAAPDVLFQPRIIDERVAVLLQVPDTGIAVDLFLAHRVFLRPFHQHLLLPVLIRLIRIVLQDRALPYKSRCARSRLCIHR